ncbi:Alpha/Beta hydrolase protein [Chaetomium strumarium]|uniref:Alpha/Beta hydrolase protein n=1 Tax=Chaetomium strumarium TaxID=1170767 RepID=A0AAJ0M594_9PEZI|nr:Alpha/Beta hydrolase protein [Chaetomium strumarium]
MDFTILIPAFLYLLLAHQAQAGGYTPPYMTLPAPPSLPDAVATGYVNLSDGVDIWYAHFGPTLEESFARGRAPVLFLHGAHASSDYWGHQIRYLLSQNDPRTILAIDSRLMGRSTYGDMTTSFARKAADAIAVLDHFHIPQAAVVGWSNGAAVLINLLLDYPSRVERAFVFAGWYDASTSLNQTTGTAQYNATSAVYFNRTLEELMRLSVHPELVPAARQAYYEEYMREPHWDSTDFARIPTGLDNCQDSPLVWYVEAAEEEVINRGVAGIMHKWTPGSTLWVLPNVSHWALLQDPVAFNDVLHRFLEDPRHCGLWGATCLNPGFAQQLQDRGPGFPLVAR